MFESYMFIPANKKRFIDKSLQLKHLDYRIFDLEDSVAEKDFKTITDNLKSIEILPNDWVRIPFGRSGEEELIRETHNLRFNNYVVPKIFGYDNFKEIFLSITAINKKAKLILLLENPKVYKELVSKTKSLGYLN